MFKPDIELNGIFKKKKTEDFKNKNKTQIIYNGFSRNRMMIKRNTEVR